MSNDLDYEGCRALADKLLRMAIVDFTTLPRSCGDFVTAETFLFGRDQWYAETLAEVPDLDKYKTLMMRKRLEWGIRQIQSQDDYLSNLVFRKVRQCIFQEDTKSNQE